MNKKMVPVYIFNEHNMAFYFWHKAKHEGYINNPLDLFHFGAHDDMSIISNISQSIYYSGRLNNYLTYYKNISKQELNISNFILPAILNKIIKNIFFIFPEWRKYRYRRKKLNIASVFGDGSAFKVNLKINEKSDNRLFKIFPDLTIFFYSMLREDKIPCNRKVLLDIDFDYFACIDTIRNHISYDIEITESQYVKRNILLKDKRLRFSNLDFNFFKKEKKYYLNISHKKVNEISFLPSEKQVEIEIDKMCNNLAEKNISPVVITLCRSSVSGFCPKDYQKLIEKKIVKKLRLLFSSWDLNIISEK